MAKLTFIEQDAFERLFNMGSGYVLDFTNRTFQAFIFDQLRIDVYKKYRDMSKAKMLRALILEYDDITIGKLLLELLNYMKTYNMLDAENRELFKQCADIGGRLIGRKTANKPAKAENLIIDYDKYMQDLMALEKYAEGPQARGFAFEKFLREFFEDNDLQPRGSFKIEGEQIDGSFILNNEVYLLEAKWRNKPTDKADLVVFNEKVSSKSGFTRGLFVSYSGYSEEALHTFASGRTINIVLMTVAELAMILQQHKEFSDFLWKKVRALAEEGDFNKSIFEII
jgi:hypothetical protein